MSCPKSIHLIYTVVTSSWKRAHFMQELSFNIFHLVDLHYRARGDITRLISLVALRGGNIYIRPFLQATRYCMVTTSIDVALHV